MDIKNKIFSYINDELNRQKNNIELIASENYVSNDVLKAMGSILTNKYAEGYPNKRYYSGCENIDKIEQLAIDLVKKIYNAKFANVQPHSGSQANFAAYTALLNQNDSVLALELNCGGHLTHGSNVNFSGKFYKFHHYFLNKKSEELDYNEIRELALKIKPKLILSGYSNYSRIINFKKFREIADEVGAYLMVDMAHIAGLIAAKFHPNPLPYADIVTSTTQKSLRGPRGGFILTNNEEIFKKINKAVFPGNQGGPLENMIAAKAICFSEALDPSFKNYAKNVIENADALSKIFIQNNFHIVSNKTENHLFTIDVFKRINVTSNVVTTWLDQINVTTNKNTIPFDSNSPNTPSGIRMGTPAMTTRGMKKSEFEKIGQIIVDVILSKGNKKVILESKKKITQVVSKLPKLYSKLKY